MLYSEMTAVCSLTLNLMVHKRTFCWNNAMHFAIQTDGLLPYVSNIGQRKKVDMQQNEFCKTLIYFVVLPSVPMPSDTYRRLCHTGSTTVHCQLTQTLYS